MKKAILLLAAIATLASCTATKGNAYNSHLKSKRTGNHQLTTNNRGCGWANN